MERSATIQSLTPTRSRSLSQLQSRSSTVLLVIGLSTFFFSLPAYSVPTALPQGSPSLPSSSTPLPASSATSSLLPSLSPSPTATSTTSPSSSTAHRTPSPTATSDSAPSLISHPAFAALIGVGAVAAVVIMILVTWWVVSRSKARKRKEQRKIAYRSRPYSMDISCSGRTSPWDENEKALDLDVAPSLLKKPSATHSITNPYVSRSRRDSAIGGVQYDPEIWGESWGEVSRRMNLRTPSPEVVHGRGRSASSPGLASPAPSIPAPRRATYSPFPPRSVRSPDPAFHGGRDVMKNNSSTPGESEGGWRSPSAQGVVEIGVAR